MKKEDFMKLWKSVEKTNPKHTKEAKLSGMKITAISPQYQRQTATEVFGPFGMGWGVCDEDYSFLDFSDGTKLVTYTATLWYLIEGVKGAFPIQSNGKVAFMTRGANAYLKVDDEYAKKTATDALTKGLSMLGFNSDIFMGRYDDNKYVNQMKQEFAEPSKVPTSAENVVKCKAAIAKAKDQTRLNVIMAEAVRLNIQSEVEAEVKAKEAELGGK